MIDLIAFDADDTLWHNETLYHAVQDRFYALLAPYMEREPLEQELFTTETGNLSYFGYGIKSFALSMIETAVRVSQGRISAADLGQIVEYAREMLRAEVRLLDQVRDTIAALAAREDLMLITKGDLLDQEAKLEHSGLREYFKYFEVVSDKTPERYAALLARYRIDPRGFLMVGNSMRSDILPVLAIGGQAVYIPYALTWAHEQVEPGEGEKHFYELENIAQLPALVDRLNQ